MRILFAEAPPVADANTTTDLGSAFRCKSLLFTTCAGMITDVNVLEWDDHESSFSFEMVMEDRPVEHSLFGDIILALYGYAPRDYYYHALTHY